VEDDAVEVLCLKGRVIGNRQTSKARNQDVAGSRSNGTSDFVADGEGPQSGLTGEGSGLDGVAENDVVELEATLNAVKVCGKRSVRWGEGGRGEARTHSSRSRLGPPTG
jgi:hypothetical protein